MRRRQIERRDTEAQDLESLAPLQQPDDLIAGFHVGECALHGFEFSCVSAPVHFSYAVAHQHHPVVLFDPAPDSISPDSPDEMAFSQFRAAILIVRSSSYTGSGS